MSLINHIAGLGEKGCSASKDSEQIFNAQRIRNGNFFVRILWVSGVYFRGICVKVYNPVILLLKNS